MKFLGKDNMKRFLFKISFLLIFGVSLSFKVSDDLKKMRELFPQINKNEEAAKALKEIARKSQTVPVALKTAYHAAGVMASAKYKINPASKLSLFNQGKKELENTFATDSNNIEIRYIRLVIQTNVPSILGYKSDIARDKTQLKAKLASVRTADPELYSTIYAYLLYKGDLTVSEKKSLR